MGEKDMATVMRCHARQHSDEMYCHRCRLRWDANDRDEPACKTDAEIEAEAKAEKARLGFRAAGRFRFGAKT
jgi:hypothetical protein